MAHEHECPDEITCHIWRCNSLLAGSSRNNDYENLGSILNDSVSFPSTKTPGAGKTFEDFFEFTLPTAEYITASMSISGPITARFRLALGN
jgi:hypothetical protein